MEKGKTYVICIRAVNSEEVGAYSNDIKIATTSVLLGSGTQNDPYQIGDAEELAQISKKPSASYLVVKDIDLSGIDWLPLTPQGFSGQLDGGGHIIKNMTTLLPDQKDIGLFSRLNGASIQNLTIENAQVAGYTNVGALAGSAESSSLQSCNVIGGTVSGRTYVGGIVGSHRGTPSYKNTMLCATADVYVQERIGGGLFGYGNLQITNSYATGNVIGQEKSSDLGGLIGYFDNNTLENCYATGSVTGGSNLGGLAGSTRTGIVRNCFAAGTVTVTVPKTINVGGLIGSSTSMVSYCYFVGMVNTESGDYIGGILGSGSYESSYFDGELTSLKGVGRSSTVAMQQRSTYTNWNFDSIWSIREGESYPYLTALIYPYETIPVVNTPILIEAAPESISISWDAISGVEGYIVSINDNVSIVTKETNYKISNLSQMKNYNIKIRAKSGASYSPWSQTLTAMTTFYPLDAPTGLCIISIENRPDHVVNLSWNDVAKAAQYDIYINDAYYGSTYQNNIRIHSLAPVTTYSFRVAAANQYTASGLSEAVTVTTMESLLPAPSGLRAENITVKSFDFLWSAVEGAEAYQVYCNNILLDTVTKNSYSFENLAPNQQYSVEIRAVKGGNAGYGNTANVWTLLNKATNISVVQRTPNSIGLAWDAVDGAKDYTVFYDGKNVKTNKNSISVQILQPNTAYTFVVQAVNGTATGVLSEPLTAFTSFGAPVGLTVSAVTIDSITLSWQGLSEAESYEVMYGETVVPVQGTTVSIGELTPRTDYILRVRGKNNNVEGIWSEAVVVRTLKAPATIPENADIKVDVDYSLTYSYVFTANDIDTFQNKVFTIKYDPKMLEVIDFASQTKKLDLSIGMIEGTDIEILSHNGGEIRFRLHKTEIAGTK